MAKRKRRTTKRKPRREALPGWVWMLFGLAVGLSVAAAIYIGDRRDGARPPTEPAEPVAASPAAETPAPAKKTPVDDRFEFYEMLPKFEVIVPEEDIEARPDVSARPVETPGVYVLQAGSFSTHNDAERMKARLALLGVVARIQKVTVDDKTYHRVRAGPVDSLAELNDMRSRLRADRIEVIVVRVGE